jgi:hypothetical protein
MALETATYIDSLVPTQMEDGDNASELDNHIRLIKASLQRTFSGVAGEVSISAADIVSFVAGEVSLSFAQSVAYAVSADHATSAGAVLSVSDAGFLSSETVLFKDADETASQEVHTDLSLAGFDYDASAFYKVDAYLRLGETGGSKGFFWKFNFSADPTQGAIQQTSSAQISKSDSAVLATVETHFVGYNECQGFYPDRAGNSAHYDEYLDATTHPVHMLGDDASIANMVVILEGQFYTSASGSFGLQWGDLPGSYNTGWARVLKAGSYIKLRKLGDL